MDVSLNNLTFKSDILLENYPIYKGMFCFGEKNKQSQLSIYFCIITLMTHTFCNAATLSCEETFGPLFQFVELFA